MRKRLLLAIVVTFLALLVLISTTVSAETVWSQPFMLGRGWFPEIETDASGRVHVVWHLYSEPYDQVIYTSTTDTKTTDTKTTDTKTLDTKTWSTPNDIAVPAPGAVYVTRPSLEYTADGTLHMTYRDMNIWYTNAPVQSAGNAQGWRKAINIGGYAYFSKLVQDHSGRLHIFLTVNFPTIDCSICFHLLHTYSDDNGENWSSFTNISHITNDNTGVAKPQIALDPDSNDLHVVWEKGLLGGGDLGHVADPSTVMYAVSRDQGESWTVPVELKPQGDPSTETQARNIAIGFDRQKRIVAVWWAIPEDVVYYRVSEDKGLSWREPRPIPGLRGIWSVYQSRLDCYSMATDSDGGLHLVLVARPQQERDDLAVVHLVWDGNNWSRPEVLATYQGDVPEWPRLAIGNGNQLHVVWFVRDQQNIWNSGAESYSVFYAHGVASAAYIPPEPLPAPVQAEMPPSITESQSISDAIKFTASTVTLDPKLREKPNSVVAISALMSENDDVALLVKSLLLPVLLLISMLLLRRRQSQNDMRARH